MVNRSFSDRPAARLAAFSFLLVLTGCGGSSSSSSDSGPGPGPGTGGGLTGDVSGAAELYFFTAGATLGATKKLFAVDPDNPANGVMVEQQIVNNYIASNETSAGSSPDNHLPNARNLPRGVISAELGVDGMNGPLSSVSHPWVVYNKPNGHLYRVSAVGDTPSPEQISNETDAEALCGAAIIPHYESPLDSLLLYQIPEEDTGDKDCGTSTWKLTTVGAGSGETPVQLYDDPVNQGGRIIPVHDWSTGAPEGVVAHAQPDDGSSTRDVIRFFADGTSESLASDVDDFFTLDRVGEDGVHLFNMDGVFVSYQPDPSGTHELTTVGGISSINQNIGGQHTARVGDNLIIVDGDQDRLLRFDPAVDEVTEVSPLPDLEESIYVRVVSTHDNIVAWVYTFWEDPDDLLNDNRIARLSSYDLDTSSYQGELVEIDPQGTTIFPSVQLNRRFSVVSEKAPGGLVFYNDFDANPSGPGDAVAVDIATGNEAARISGSEWWGYTWSRDIPIAGRAVGNLLIADFQEEKLKARSAGDPQLNTEVVFENTPEDLERVSVQSYGSRTLGGMISDGSTSDSRVMLFMDLLDGNSLTRLTDDIYGLARPVPFY